MEIHLFTYLWFSFITFQVLQENTLICFHYHFIMGLLMLSRKGMMVIYKRDVIIKSV